MSFSLYAELGGSTGPGLEPGEQTVDNVGRVEELDERGDQGVCQAQEKYLVDQPIGQVDVPADVEVGYHRH